MPEYLYKCTACGKGFSKIMVITEVGKARVTCPKCSSKKVERRITAFHAITSKKS